MTAPTRAVPRTVNLDIAAAPAQRDRPMLPRLSPAALRAWRTALGVCLLAILLLAVLPAPPPGLDTGWDKLNHLLAFAVLAVCVCMCQPLSWRRRGLWLFGLLCYGAAIEALQSLTPTRQAEWADLLADALGIALGTLLGMALLHLTARLQARRARGAAWRAKA